VTVYTIPKGSVALTNMLRKQQEERSAIKEIVRNDGRVDVLLERSWLRKQRVKK